MNPWWELALRQFWQVTLAAVGLGGIALVIRRRRPHLAYLLWMLVIVKSMTPPLWSSGWGVFCETMTAPTENRAEIASLPSRDPSQDPEPILVESRVTLTRADTGTLEFLSNHPVAAPPRRQASPLPLAGLGFAWLSGCVVMGGLILRKALRFSGRLRGHRKSTPWILDQQIDQLRCRLGVRRRVRTHVYDQPLVPCTTGVLRPRILLGQPTLDELDARELRGVLAHELMHVRRWDSLANGLQLASQCVWWFHPLVWWVNREARRERERCCDEGVVAHLNCPAEEYARTLLHVLESQTRFSTPQTLLGMATFGSTQIRLASLVRHSGKFRPATPFWQWSAALVFALVILPGGPRKIEAEEANGEATAQSASTADAEATSTSAGEPKDEPSDDPDKTAPLEIPFAEYEAYQREQKLLSDPNEKLVDVQIDGNTTIPTATIVSLLKTQPGQIPNKNQVREDVRTLYKTMWFFNVDPRFRRTDEGLVLVFKLRERPIVKSVEYKGNKKIKTKNLLNLTGLLPGKSLFSTRTNREVVERILQHYHEKGFAEAKVSLEKGEMETDRDVIFLIDEGPMVHVVARKFTGNKFFSSQLLRSKLKTKTSLTPTLGWHVIGGKYDPSLVEDDVTALKEYYHSLGFFSVAITPIVHFSDDRADVTIEFTIEEGPRHKVRKIEIEGNKVLSEARIREYLDATKSDEYFNAERVNEAIEKIKDDYGEMGRLFASVEIERRSSDESGIVDLVLHINEDVVYRIRRIGRVIHDNSEMSDSTALNGLPFAPGDLAILKEIESSSKRTKSGAKIDYCKVAQKPGWIDILIIPNGEEGAKRIQWRGGEHIDPRVVQMILNAPPSTPKPVIIEPPAGPFSFLIRANGEKTGSMQPVIFNRAEFTPREITTSVPVVRKVGGKLSVTAPDPSPQ